MKKWILLSLCLCLFLATASAVSAEGSAHMQLSSAASTVYRGDTFTVTVTLHNDQPIKNGGVILSYDSSVFSFVGGSCQVTNATLSQVVNANQGGVFAMETDTVVSGTVFTFRLQVKEGAAFGSYTISGTPSLNIPCSLGSTSVTVACKHSYQNCTTVDSSKHQSTCKFCGDIRQENHNWDDGTVTKAATCKQTGIKKLTCTDCGQTKEETVPLTDQHKYGSWSTAGDSQHRRTCSVCQKTETAQHSWNSGTVTKSPTCTATGTKKLTCTGCGQAKTVTLSKTEHDYETTAIDEASHKRICRNCGHSLTQEHSFGNWEHDENWHYKSCSLCGQKDQQAAHTPGPEATEDTDQICTVCQRILQPKGEHVHSFSSQWSTDETGHWHSCGGCNEKDSAAPHSYQDDCDSDCDICGYIRTAPHIPEDTLSADASGHWYRCSSCDAQLSFSAHSPGPEATISSPQLCTVCGFELAPVLPHEHQYDSTHRHACACGQVYEAAAEDCQVCGSFPWYWICIGEAVVFAGALVALYLYMKKRSKTTV